MKICNRAIRLIQPQNRLVDEMKKLRIGLLVFENLVKHFVEKYRDGAFHDIQGDVLEYRSRLSLFNSLQGTVIFMVDDHIQYVQRLKHISMDFCFRLFDTVYEVGL